MAPKPLVTVLMPVYNTEKYVNSAIQSILNQSYQNFEFIIINDGSTDSSEDVILSYKDPRIKYYKNEKNLKLIATLNRGFDLARGKYIARMDADDISLPSRLQRQVDFMESNDSIGLCGTWFETFEGEKALKVSKYSPDHETICFKHLYQIHLSHGTCMFRRKVLKDYQLYFNPDFSHAEDYELWSRISRVTKLHNIQEVLYRVRQHENEVSVKYSAVQTENSYRVKARLFDYLDVQVSHAEIDLFRSIAYCDYQSDASFLIQTQKLLEKMMLAKNYEVFFSKIFYEEKLAGYWLNVCYNSAKYFGNQSRRHYYKNPLAALKPLNLKTKLKFGLKGIFRI